MNKRLHASTTDYLVMALSPALIMTMIGSLVFFLLAIFYQGDHDSRLRLIFAFFILGTVMLGRLSIEEGKEYAALYAAPLGLVTFMALMRFVRATGPLAGLSVFINLGIMFLVWWLAHKLTWDCTLIDDDVDASGEGLLEEFGLDQGEVVERTGRNGGSAADTADVDSPRMDRVEQAAGVARDWWRRWLRRRGGQQRPGLWVVYLSLAAVPVFGLGQRMIPEANGHLRDSAFRLLYVYLASALGLLLTTSFLGLRRYLRQRRVEMPVEMTGLWMVAGAVSIMALLVVCMLIPTRGNELPFLQAPLKLLSPDNLTTSDYAMLDEGQHDPSATRTGDPGREASSSESGEHAPQGQGDPASENGSGSSTTPSNSSSQSGEGQGSQGSQQGEGEGKQSGGGESSGGESSSSQNAESQNSSSSESGSKSGESSNQSANEGNENSESSQSGETQSDASSSSPRRPPFSPARAMNQLLGSLESIFRFAFYMVLLIITAYFAWKYRERLLAALADFMNWLRAMLAGKSAAASTAEAELGDPGPRFRSFAEYSNPFRDGRAAKMAPGEVVAYTFAAFEAWGRERGTPREAEQTPLEFTRAVATAAPWMAKEVGEMGALYNRAAYARSTLTTTHVNALQPFWQKLESSAQPAAVGRQ
ncbi:MAG: DUF4129 domain-containing protein [Pirellulaceae bacterium]